MNQIKTYKWYQLLDLWCNKSRRRGYGLTIPYLIGATKIESINELLLEISKTKTEQRVVIRFCHDLWEFVLSLEEPEVIHAIDYTNFENLYIKNETLEKLDSLDKVIDYLRSKYEPIILNGNFSKNKVTGNWEGFTETDKKLIEKTI